MSDKAIMITDPDKIREISVIMRIHKWRSIAYAKIEWGERPPAGWTVKRFNAEYRDPTSAVPNWKHVYALCDAVIKSEREDRQARS
jgi:hypothetical protein